MTSLLTATHVPQRWLYGVLIAARMINVRAVYAQSACQQQVRVASIVGNLWVRAMQSGLDLGIRRSVVRFVDIRFAVRAVLRAIVLQYFWDSYVGRHPDFQGSVRHWQRACQEIADYPFAYDRCVCDNERVSRFSEQFDILCYRIVSTEELM